MGDTEDRLVRIEQKVDKLAEAMIALARAEEKLAGLKDDHTNMYERVNRLSAKLDGIEKVVMENHTTITTINRLFWIAIVAAAGSIAAQVWM
jgi:phosphosulfolactate synthase (CoM biosynthesis protein A)